MFPEFSSNKRRKNKNRVLFYLKFFLAQSATQIKSHIAHKQRQYGSLSVKPEFYWVSFSPVKNTVYDVCTINRAQILPVDFQKIHDKKDSRRKRKGSVECHFLFAIFGMRRCHRAYCSFFVDKTTLRSASKLKGSTKSKVILLPNNPWDIRILSVAYRIILQYALICVPCKLGIHIYYVHFHYEGRIWQKNWHDKCFLFPF